MAVSWQPGGSSVGRLAAAPDKAAGPDGDHDRDDDKLAHHAEEASQKSPGSPWLFADTDEQRAGEHRADEHRADEHRAMLRELVLRALI